MINILSPITIIYIISGLILVLIFLLIWNIRLEIKIKRLLRGKNSHSIEDSIIKIQSDLNNLQIFKAEIEKHLINVEKRLSTSIRSVENINFNAFTGLESGGKSFATVFLNEKGDGIILSSLHARDRISVFVKQIKKYKSNIELSEEEKNVLTKAKESCIV
ncbi:MAG TPA: DUF4446 family protein [Candidatus Paceibacterota bacterium]|nr:DUF4446 family protein [Candidatus Paceibacterota bacterium]HMP18815.1 DUF4446 family protein [Candidatus Paceibacterota bacterium]HMP85413.1 DUF4446 family protein [Candidatus Paceibacterota bacterium]